VIRWWNFKRWLMSAIPYRSQPQPHFVSIPDPQRTVGIRAYREPAEPHPLQLAFLDAAGERAWLRDMCSLLATGRAEEADERLSAEIAGFDGSLARLCKASKAADVLLEGWEDLLPILTGWEGSPITAITIGLSNPPDLVFHQGPAPEPELLICLYSDDNFAFSRTTKAALLIEFGKEAPAWVGAEEDIEFYCKISGLAEINAALINCKHRHFLRDGRDGVDRRAPGGYVEYVLGCWLLAARFLAAVTRAVSIHGAPADTLLVVGTVDMKSDFVAVIDPGELSTSRSIVSRAPEPSFAKLTAKPVAFRKDPTWDGSPSHLTLRQRLRSVDPEPVQVPRGLLARLFSRMRAGQ
jgi:hypothetical protein